MSRKTLLAALVGLPLAACGTNGLGPLVLGEQELDTSLVAQQIDDVPRPHVPRAVLRSNPQVSTDAEFVEAIARAGSQGQLGGEGVRAALYALYRGESEVGFSGSEAESAVAADRRESLPLYGGENRSASMGWRPRRRRTPTGSKASCAGLGRTTARCWEAVNAAVVERLPTSGIPIGPAASNPQPR